MLTKQYSLTKEKKKIFYCKKFRKLFNQKQNQLSHSCEVLQKNKYFN